MPNSTTIIDGHVEKFFSDDEVYVFHENESVVVHSDIYIIKSNNTRPFQILLTSGLSALPMKTPTEPDIYPRAEIMMLLPVDLDLSAESFSNENNYWPIRTLKQMTLFPHLNNTWLGYGHTFPLDRSIPVDHDFTAVILLKSITLPEGFSFINTDSAGIDIFTAIPLYQAELNYRLENGIEKLLQLFADKNLSEVVNTERPSLIPH